MNPILEKIINIIKDNPTASRLEVSQKTGLSDYKILHYWTKARREVLNKSL